MGGQFSGPLLIPGAVYEVKGHVLLSESQSTGTTPAPAVVTSHPASPFGAYPFPTYPRPPKTMLAQPPHPPMKRKKGWSKTIIIVSLKKKSSKGAASRGNMRVEYEIVTQVSVFLDPSSSTVRKVAELVKRQIDVDVILLDSKCYPLLENDSTSGELYWRSTRKVLAANRSIYSKLTGDCTDLGNASIDATQEDTGEESDSSSMTNVDFTPSSKRPCPSYDSSSIYTKLQEIANGVANIQKLTMFMQNMHQVLQCVVCRGTVSSPVVAKCCGQIVGCQRCVTSWLEHHATCPHCASVMIHHFELKGFDEAIKCLQMTMEKQDPLQPVHAVPTPPRYPSPRSSDTDPDFPAISM